MRRGSALAVAALLLLVAAPARAVLGTADDVPAATLLIPYFEVDFGNANGVTTLVAIQNTSATAILAHVTLWTDLGIPTYVFDVYLTGFDTQVINMRDVFDGGLPHVASAGQDPTDTISPHGILSQDINFASCSGFMPGPPYPGHMFDPAHLRAWHSGAASPISGDCAGHAWGGSIARGYLTIDTVNACNLSKPGDPGYFVNGGAGIATNQNVMVGDWMIIDAANNFADGDRAIAIEGPPWTWPAPPDPFPAGSYTFYGRLIGASGADDREPLPSTWGGHYMNAPTSGGGSRLRVWRDPGLKLSPFTCGSTPQPFPLSNADLVAFDSEENATDVAGSPFPWATQVVRVGTDVTVPHKQGWLYLNLNAAAPLPVGELYGGLRQAWVTVVGLPEGGAGRFTASWTAVQIGTPFHGDNVILIP
jgi:hypothetical protein